MKTMTFKIQFIEINNKQVFYFNYIQKMDIFLVASSIQYGASLHGQGLVMINAWYPRIVWNQILVKLVEFLILVLVHSAFSTVEWVSPYKNYHQKIASKIS